MGNQKTITEVVLMQTWSCLKLERWSEERHSNPGVIASYGGWIAICDLPFNLWNHRTFELIGKKCGGLLEIDCRTKSFDNLFEARVKESGASTMEFRQDFSASPSVGEWRDKESEGTESKARVEEERHEFGSDGLRNALFEVGSTPEKRPLVSHMLEKGQHGPSNIQSHIRKNLRVGLGVPYGLCHEDSQVRALSLQPNELDWEGNEPMRFVMTGDAHCKGVFEDLKAYLNESEIHLGLADVVDRSNGEFLQSGFSKEGDNLGGESNRVVFNGVDTASHLPINSCAINDNVTHLEIDCSREMSSNHRLGKNNDHGDSVDETGKDEVRVMLVLNEDFKKLRARYVIGLLLNASGGQDFVRVYGPNRPNARLGWWGEMAGLFGLCSPNWCVGGDFNVVRRVSEKLNVGAVLVDWTRNSTNPRSSTHPSDSVFDFTGNDSFNSGAAADDDATFRLVDSKPPSRPRFGPKWQLQQQRNHLPQRCDEEVEAKKSEAEKEQPPVVNPSLGQFLDFIELFDAGGGGDNMTVTVQLYDERPMSASVPQRVTCKVVEAQVPMKGIAATPQ
ncbi:hypothetical protein CsSME_00042487 [Camellia sinensis var. sinensis]